MRPFVSTISLDEARSRLEATARPINRVERVPLAGAAGRVSAVDVASAIDVPPFARAAMDGYAVVAAATTGATADAPRTLRVIDRVYTGERSSATVAAGVCVEIATGAPVPAGADAVVMVEQTTKAPDGAIQFLAEANAGQNIGRQAADIARGDVVVHAGDLLTPSRIGALAAIGHGDAAVYTKPRVAILSTGNEIVGPGAPLGTGQIYDVNRFTMSAVVGMHGGMAEPLRPAGDTLEALERALDEAADADLIVFSGGSSVGERDLIIDLIATRGQVVFHGVAIKPGKPTAFAILGGKPFFGMPGNPTSCLSNAYVLLIPYLRQMARLPPHQPRTVRVALGRRIASSEGRHQFYTVRLEGAAALPAFKGSGDITSLSQADGYIEIPANEKAIEQGTLVDVILF